MGYKELRAFCRIMVDAVCFGLSAVLLVFGVLQALGISPSKVDDKCVSEEDLG